MAARPDNVDRSPLAPPSPLCGPRMARPQVYYDGACPLCRVEIAGYQHSEGGDRLCWIDASHAPQAALGPDLDRATALARLHVRRVDGSLVQGAAACAEIWAALPRWRWMARMARLPVLLPLLDLGYSGFLWFRHLRCPAPGPLTEHGLPLTESLVQALRSDHAGETGAVMIYRGILAVARDPVLRRFARQHRATEEKHLALIEANLSPPFRSRLLPLWRLAGWLTGALPALCGARAVYATIEAVESFVDRHYAAQIALIDAQPDVLAAASRGPAGRIEMRPVVHSDDVSGLRLLREVLEQCRSDEAAHRDDAAARWDGRAGPLLAAWRLLVGRGSAAAVAVCRHL